MVFLPSEQMQNVKKSENVKKRKLEIHLPQVSLAG